MGSINTDCTDAAQRTKIRFLHLGFEDILEGFFHLGIKFFDLYLLWSVSLRIWLVNSLLQPPSVLPIRPLDLPQLPAHQNLLLIHAQISILDLFLSGSLPILSFNCKTFILHTHTKVQPTDISPLFSLLLHLLCWASLVENLLFHNKFILSSSNTVVCLSRNLQLDPVYPDSLSTCQLSP